MAQDGVFRVSNKSLLRPFQWEFPTGRTRSGSRYGGPESAAWERQDVVGGVHPWPVSEARRQATRRRGGISAVRGQHRASPAMLPVHPGDVGTVGRLSVFGLINEDRDNAHRHKYAAAGPVQLQRKNSDGESWERPLLVADEPGSWETVGGTLDVRCDIQPRWANPVRRSEGGLYRDSCAVNCLGWWHDLGCRWIAGIDLCPGTPGRSPKSGINGRRFAG